MTSANENTARGKNMIHLAIAFDQNYYLPFLVLLNSILVNHTKPITFHLIASGIDTEKKNKIGNTINKRNCKVQFYTISEIDFSQYKISDKWTSAVYYRLLFPLIIPFAINRLLYLDTDTVVLRPLDDLYNLELRDYPVGAAIDTYVKTQPLIGITEEGTYFNSGVLLIDPIKWRNKQISEQTFEYVKKYPERIKFVDQCGLNAILKNNWMPLDTKYNLMYSSIPPEYNRRQLKEFIQDKVVLHFTLQRPWNMLCKNRLRNIFFFYWRTLPERTFIFPYIDFSLKKIPEWLRIRIVEVYLDSPILRKLWTVVSQNKKA